MSDIPELDRMLDEHRIFKFNVSWERSEKLQAALSRLSLLLIMFLASILVLGPFGIFALLFLPWACRFAKTAFPDPPKRDPFVRYMVR